MSNDTETKVTKIKELYQEYPRFNVYNVYLEKEDKSGNKIRQFAYRETVNKKRNPIKEI